MALWAAKQPVSESSPEVRRQPLMQLAAKLNRALGEFDADLRAGGFGQNCRGLARQLYASFTATIAATEGTEAEARAWAIGHGLAIDLYRSGRRRGALALLEGLVELAASQSRPEILARLTNAVEAIDRTMGWRRRASARAAKVAGGPSAAAIHPVEQPAAQDAGGEGAVSAGESERPTPSFVPPPDLLPPRRRSRRGAVTIAVAATAVVGIALYLFVTHDGKLIRQSLSTLTSAMTSPSEVSLANASTTNAPAATVPKAIGSPDNATTGAPATGTAGRTAADARETSPPRGPGQFLLPDGVRYAKARTDQLKAHASLVTRVPPADTPLLDLKTHDGAAAVQARLKALGYYHSTVDGKWGPRSAAALSSFRQEKGLSSGRVWDLAAQSALLGE